MVKQINGDEFLDTIKNGKVVVDFFATWCGPCQMLGPVLEELSAEIDDIKFYKVDIDQANSVAAQFGISGVPALALFKDGQHITTLVGFKPKPILAQEIQQSFN